MSHMNKIMLIGNLGRDPEMSYTNNGTAVTKFSLAVSRRTKSPTGERQEETEWFNIVAWRQLAETCSQYLRKGPQATSRVAPTAFEGESPCRDKAPGGALQPPSAASGAKVVVSARHAAKSVNFAMTTFAKSIIKTLTVS